MPYTAEPGGLLLAVKLTPRAKTNAICGTIPDAAGRLALHIRLAAPPVEGAANKALIAFLAGTLGVRKSDVTLLSGDTARQKRLHLAGDPTTLAAKLDALSRSYL